MSNADKEAVGLILALELASLTGEGRGVLYGQGKRNETGLLQVVC